jgi:HAD superfamily hydrolase (TIGR01509 family)
MVRNRTGLKAVILDMDGLMLDTEPIYRLAVQRAAADLGYRIDDDFYATLLGLNYADTEGELARAFGTDFPLSSFGIRCAEHWRTYVREHGIPRKPGLTELLDLLDDLGTPKAVATSSSQEAAWYSLRVAGLEGRLGCVITSDQVERGKPAPDLFLAAAAELNVLPTQCLAFEDSDAGVIAACAAGMLTIMVPDLKRPSAHAASLAHSILASLHEARQVLREILPARPEG